MSVTEDVLMADTGKIIKILLRNWNIIYPIFHHDELPLYQQEENNFLHIIMLYPISI